MRATVHVRHAEDSLKFRTAEASNKLITTANCNKLIVCVYTVMSFSQKNAFST